LLGCALVPRLGPAGLSYAGYGRGVLPRPRAWAGLLLVGGLLAGCQSQSAINREPHNGSTTAAVVNGVQQVTITTDQSYRFAPSTITVRPGRVQLVLRHLGTGAPHDWQLTGFPDDYVPLVTPGQQKSIEFTAPAPGKYTFICTIHVAQGQTGTLIVLPG
jgi:plastocyanin